MSLTVDRPSNERDLARRGLSVGPFVITRYDSDASDFIDRSLFYSASAFDLTASNAAYNSNYSMKRWNDFVKGLKADGAWDAITEWVPMRGINWINSGALPKLKYDTTETVASTSDFSAGTDGYTAVRASVAGNQDSVGPVGDLRDDCLTATENSGNNTHYFNKSSVLTVGRYYRIRVQCYIPTANSHVDGVRIASFGASDDYSTTGEWFTAEASGVATQDRVQFFMLDGGSDTFDDSGNNDVVHIRNVVVTELSPATVINQGFVTGDYDPIVGLTGDRASYLDTGFWFPKFANDDMHIAAMCHGGDALNGRTVMGADDNGGPVILSINGASGTSVQVRMPANDGNMSYAAATFDGHILGTRRSSTDLEAYLDGVSQDTDNSAALTTANFTCNLGIFAQIDDVNGVENLSDAVISHVHYGTGAVTAQALAISNRIATLNAAFS